MSYHRKYSLEYKKRIHKAITHIRENLDKPITVKEVAAAACFSEYHFHRIFTDMMGETLGEYITRKKLEYAAIKLVYSPDSKVSDLAFEFGYASVSGFSKAFKRRFGCSPGEISKIRQQIETAEGKLRTGFETQIDTDRLYGETYGNERSPTFEASDQRVRIRSITSFELSYLTSPKGYDLESIRRTWTELLERIYDLNIDPNQCDRFSLSHDHPALTPSARCRYDACISLPPEKAEKLSLPKVVIPSGRYAVFPVEGPQDSILDQYLEFYTLWMPQSGYEADRFPVLEHYLESCQGTHLSVELWAKIRRRSLF